MSEQVSEPHGWVEPGAEVTAGRHFNMPTVSTTHDSLSCNSVFPRSFLRVEIPQQVLLNVYQGECQTQNHPDIVMHQV